MKVTVASASRANIFSVISALLGAVLLSCGAALVYRPLGLLTAGAVLLSAAFVSAKR